jgi:hypothetical protein
VSPRESSELVPLPALSSHGSAVPSEASSRTPAGPFGNISQSECADLLESSEASFDGRDETLTAAVVSL